MAFICTPVAMPSYPNRLKATTSANGSKTPVQARENLSGSAVELGQLSYRIIHRKQSARHMSLELCAATARSLPPAEAVHFLLEPKNVAGNFPSLVALVP